MVNSPIFFISERDTVDKRMEFIHEDVFYNFTTSIEEGVTTIKFLIIIIIII